MDFFIIILLGLVQGITEFLPISSSGHLVLIEKIFNINCDLQFLNVILHFATLIAVVIFYRKKLWYLVSHPFCKTNIYLVIATIPAIIFVLLFKNFIDTHTSSSVFLGVGFILSAVFLFVGVILSKKTPKNAEITPFCTAIMGISQAFAIFPGLSRSGTTLSFGLMANTKRESVLDFSFLMSIPIILASLIYEIFTTPVDLLINEVNIWAIILSFAVAVVSAFFAIKLMKNAVLSHKIIYFVPYLAILGFATILFIK